MSSHKNLRICLFIVTTLLSLSLAAEEKFRLATTSSIENSGLLSELLPEFQQQTGYTTEVSVVGSGRALQMGRKGLVDAVLVHAPESEKNFVREGFGLTRHAVMHNDFVLLGPAQDPAGIAGSTSIQEALKRIAESHVVFISRGDGSGTHRKEASLWQSIPLDPHWTDWYQELGSGMAGTLFHADSHNAYTLSDRGTWLAKQQQVTLQLLYSGDSLLINPYTVIAVNPKAHPRINHTAANRFIEWLVSPTTQQTIANFRINNQTLFIPSLTQEEDKEGDKEGDQDKTTP